MANFIRYGGLSLIIIFSIISIFIYQFKREFRGKRMDRDHPFVRYTMYTDFFEDRFYDIRMRRARDKPYKSKDQVLIELTDESISHVGYWPFKRDVWAKVVDRLNHFGAKIIGSDIFFFDKSLSCGKYRPDEELAAAISRFNKKEGRKFVLGYKLTHFKEEAMEEIPDSLYEYAIISQQEPNVELEEQYIHKGNFPIKKLVEAESGLAFIGAIADLDGLFRHYEIAASLDGDPFPSFGLLLYELYTGDKTNLWIKFDQSYLELKGEKKLLINNWGESKIRWLGRDHNFERISIERLLTASLDDPEMHAKINGKLTLLGSSAFGAHDLRHTPLQSDMPGVYFHMNMIEMLLTQYFYKDFQQSINWSYLLLALSTIIMIAISFFKLPILDLFTLLAINAILIYVDLNYFIPNGYQITLFFILFSVIGSYSWDTLINFYFANKDKKFLKNAFSNYISPELIDQMYQAGEPPKLGGDSGVRTAFFTDIQGFSTFSEKLSATQLVELLNEYLTAMTDILLEEGGTLDKYEGDAIIAFFGAPMPQEDHASRALTTAHRMQEKLIRLRKKWVSEGDKWPSIVHEMRMRIGINSGEIVTGNMGSTSRMNYTMMGDAVNLAARLESSAKQYGIFTHIAKESVDLAHGQFVVRELDTVLVVGKSEPVQSFDLLGLRNQISDDLLSLKEKFEKAIALYKKQAWQKAIAAFEEALEYENKRFPELTNKTNPSKEYISRCQSFIENPPGEDWDGVYRLTEK